MFPASGVLPGNGNVTVPMYNSGQLLLIWNTHHDAGFPLVVAPRESSYCPSSRELRDRVYIHATLDPFDLTL